jgi:hypothetical protein
MQESIPLITVIALLGNGIWQWRCVGHYLEERRSRFLAFAKEVAG